MEGGKIGRHTTRKRQVSKFLKQVKQLDPLVCTHEHVGSISEPTSKNKKLLPESSLARDHNWASPVKGQREVVFALFANHGGAQNVQWSNNLAQTVKRRCVMDLDNHLPLSLLTDEPERRVHSDPGKKHLPVSARNKFSITSMCNHFSDLMEVKLDCFGSEISTNSLTTASFSLKMNGATIGEVQNQEVPPTNSVDVAMETADIPDSETKRKGYSDRGNIDMSKSRRSKFSKTLVNSHPGQNLKEHNLDRFDGKISTSPVTAVVNNLVNDNVSCKVQNQESPFDEIFEASSKAEGEQDKARSPQPDIKGKRRSARRNIRELGSVRNKSVRSGTSTNNHLDQNLVGEKSDRINGKTPNSLKTALFHQRKVNGDTLCEVQKQAVALNKSTEASPGTGEKHDELQKRRSNRLKKQMPESWATTSGITASKDNQVGDKSTLSGVKNNEVQVSKGLETASEVSDKQGELCETQQKRKEMMRSDQINSQNGSIGVSDITVTNLHSSVTETSDLVLMRNERNGEVLLDDDLVAVQSKSLFDCSNTDLNHTSCYETESSLVDPQNVRIYRRKDKKLCDLTNSLESGADSGWYEVSINCSSALTENGELEPPGEDELNLGQKVVPEDGYSNKEMLGKATSFSLDGKLSAEILPPSGAAEISCAPCSQIREYVTDGDEQEGASAVAHSDKVLPSPKHPAEQNFQVTVEALAQDKGMYSEDVGNDPCIQNEGVVLGCISTDVADASEHLVEQTGDVTVDALAPAGAALVEDVGDDPCCQNQSFVFGCISTAVSKYPVKRICDVTDDARAQESGALSEDVGDDYCVQDQSVMLSCVPMDFADTSKHPVQENCDISADALAQESGALSGDVRGDPSIQNQNVVLDCLSIDFADTSERPVQDICDVVVDTLAQERCALSEDVCDDPSIQNQNVVLDCVSTDVTNASMVVIGGVSVHSRHVELYRRIVDRFGPFVHLESKEMKVWGHTTFVMLGEFLDTVARFMHVTREGLSEADLEFLEIRFSKFDGFGFSVGWFQKYIAQLRELPSLDMRIREVEVQLISAEQERDKLENRIRLSRIELGELRQHRVASVDVFGTSAI